MVHTLNMMEAKLPKKLQYPKSVFFIVTNEFCERFSYYGMRTILSLYLRDKIGFDEDGATIFYHVFTMFAYFFPLLGAFIADAWLGRYRTILYLSMVYALGCVLISLSAMPPLNLPGLAFAIISLLLVAFGTGGIKPCVSAFGGDQFKLPEQERYLAMFFSLFYFAINAGSLISTFLTPVLRADVHCFGENDCYSLAFGVPGILMIVSILIFVAGKRLYKINNPSGNIFGRVAAVIGRGTVKSFSSKEKREHWLDHADDKYDKDLVDDVKGLLRVLVLFIPLPVFWALFDQQGSRWTFQAVRMEQQIGSWTLKADQMQVLNPLLILAFIPLFEVVIYPFMTWCRLIRKPLHKMIWGGLLAAAAFVISGIVELQLLPTYGTPVTQGVSQLRVYNGFPCNFTLTSNFTTDNITIGPLGAYEKLDFDSKSNKEIPYSLLGESTSVCQGVEYSGNFVLQDETAMSYFIKSNGVFEFVDNNDKVLTGAGIRFLANTLSPDEVSVVEVKTNKTVQSFSTNSTSQRVVERGTYDIAVAGQTVFQSFKAEPGAVYTLNVYQGADSVYKGDTVMITPPNSISILWLVPQYVVITMGEVMFSVTGLEFSFTQAPITMKSVLQSVWLITVAFGNLIVILIVEARFFDAQWKEFFLFAGLMVADMCVFTLMAFRYQYVMPTSSSENIAGDVIMTDNNTAEKAD